MFDSQFLQQLEYLSLLSRRVFKGQLLAQRRTKQLGGGVEFSDHRGYIHGDDLRYLDWKVYARHGDLLLKRFQEEEDLHVYLLLDCSGSMNGAGHNGAGHNGGREEVDKFLFARQIAAAIGYIALADLDRVGIYGYTDRLVETMPPLRGKNNVMSMLRFLERMETGGTKTDLAGVARDFIRRAPRTGLAIVISDLFDQDGFRGGIDVLRHHRFEPHVVQIHTPAEANPTWKGDLELRDVESGQSRKVTITERKLKQYRRLFEQFLDDVEQHCRTHGLSHTRATNDVPFDQVLLKMMRASGAVT